jgi:hypothetical protein
MTFPYWLSALVILVGCGAAHAAAPANDNLINAVLLTGTDAKVDQATNRDATKEIGEPSHAAPGGKSVWWKWVAPAGGSVVIRTTGSSFDTVLAAYTGSSIGTLTLVQSNDDSGSAKTSLLAFNVSASMAYLIAVDGYSGESGSIALSLAFRTDVLPSAPPNDHFARRISLQGPTVTATGASYYATKETREPNHADELGGASVWWTWTAPVSGLVLVDTEGSNFDTILAVYTGTAFSNLVAVASSDDVSTNIVTSLVSFQAKANTAYQIAVDGFEGEPGDIQLHIAMKDALWVGLPTRLAPGGYQFDCIAPAGKQYALETSSNLTTWEPLVTQLSTDGTLQLSDSAPPPNRRFYRLRQLP